VHVRDNRPPADACPVSRIKPVRGIFFYFFTYVLKLSALRSFGNPIGNDEISVSRRDAFSLDQRSVSNGANTSITSSAVCYTLPPILRTSQSPCIHFFLLQFDFILNVFFYYDGRLETEPASCSSDKNRLYFTANPMDRLRTLGRRHRSARCSTTFPTTDVRCGSVSNSVSQGSSR